MDEFIFVLLAGLLMIGVLLVAWGTPGQEGINGTQVLIENPFSIGVFPKDVSRIVPLGDFKISQAVGSNIFETKRDAYITSKEKYTMSATIDQDLSMVTSGFINIYVRDTNKEGGLIVIVNGKEIFNQIVNFGKIEIPINKEDMSSYNVVEITCSKPGWKFWVKPYYKLDKVEVGANFYGNLQKTEQFQVFPEELRNFRSAEVFFKLAQYSGDGEMTISINGYRIYKGQPSLDFHQSFDQYQVGLRQGLNTISFTADSGATFEIRDAGISIVRSETAQTSRSFEFTVGNSWDEELRGTISFRITDTDYGGNLLVTITDGNGMKHPTEAFQSYRVGETKTIDIDKNVVTRGKNIITFEASGGNFVISNLEIKPK
ncbi:MAG: hypothetical protein QXY45_01530 [Candidatus Aenigmatarchaeota archaeon]